MNQDQRAAFEAWATDGFHLQRGLNGDYRATITQIAWACWQEAYQSGRAALQSQKPKTNDMMLSAVIRMPFEMAMADPISRMQFYQRAQQALNELEALQSQDRTAWINTLERKAEALWTAAGEDRHEAMKDLLHHARIGLQSQDRGGAFCVWHNDPETDNSWDTDCRQLFEIYDGTPNENRMKFCCYCGKPIRESIDHARRVEGEANG